MDALYSFTQDIEKICTKLYSIMRLSFMFYTISTTDGQSYINPLRIIDGTSVNIVLALGMYSDALQLGPMKRIEFITSFSLCLSQYSAWDRAVIQTLIHSIMGVFSNVTPIKSHYKGASSSKLGFKGHSLLVTQYWQCYFPK